MCTNRALVHSLECYMEELVDSFEDFVKKSLFMMSLGVCTVIAMFVYLMKKLLEKQNEPIVQARESPTETTNTSVNRKTTYNTTTHKNAAYGNTTSSSVVRRSRSTQSCHAKDQDIISTTSDVSNEEDKQFSINAILPICPRVAEKTLREIGLSSCSKTSNPSKMCNSSMSRISIPSLSPCYRKPVSKKSSKHLSRSSCCSMCCQKETKRI